VTATASFCLDASLPPMHNSRDRLFDEQLPSKKSAPEANALTLVQ